MDYFWQNAKFVSRWKEATSKAPLRLSVNELLLISNFQPNKLFVAVAIEDSSKPHIDPFESQVGPFEPWVVPIEPEEEEEEEEEEEDEEEKRVGEEQEEEVKVELNSAVVKNIEKNK